MSAQSTTILAQASRWLRHRDPQFFNIGRLLAPQGQHALVGALDGSGHLDWAERAKRARLFVAGISAASIRVEHLTITKNTQHTSHRLAFRGRQ